MARTTLAVQQIERSGLAPAYSAANVDGHAVPNNGVTFIQVKNVSGSPVTVTIQLPQTVDGQTVPNKTVSVPATTGDRMIGPFTPALYNQPNTDQVYVDFSAVTSVTVAALRLA